MSVLIKDMEKPKYCYAIIDGKVECCPFVNTDYDCVLLLKKGICEETWKEQYSKCPLVETLKPCEDAVSRADVEIEIANLLKGVFVEYEDIAKKVTARLPSVTPKRKTGKWISHRPPDGFVLSLFSCDQCGYVNLGRSKYCPNCGARMDREVPYEMEI